MALAYAAIFLAATLYDWKLVWSQLGVPSIVPEFFDLRTIQGALHSVESGFDPRTHNVYDPSSRGMNYPWLWIEIGKLLSLEQSHNVYAFGIASAVIFTLVVLWLIYQFPSPVLFAAALSSATLLGIERGNNDLIIFALVFIAAIAPTYLSTLAIAAAGVLKIYPFLAAPFIVKKPLAVTVFVAIAASYLLYTADDLRAVLAATPTPTGLGYGTKSIQQSLKFVVKWWQIASLVCIACLAFAIFLLNHNSFAPVASKASAEDPCQRLMVAGASIYTTTFLVGANWDYRLIFLLLVLPYAVNSSHLPRWIRHSITASVLLALNETWLSRIHPISSRIITSVAEALLAVTLGGLVISVLLRSVPRLDALLHLTQLASSKRRTGSN